MRLLPLSTLLGLHLAACTSSPISDGGHDMTSLDQLNVAVDGGRSETRPPDGPHADGGHADGGAPCHCRPGEVYRRSACVPTPKLGCGAPLGPECQPQAPNPGCTGGASCDPCTAWPSCDDTTCLSHCLSPGSPVLIGPLRITPTQGTTGQTVGLLVAGASFTSGNYTVRVDGQELAASSDGPCSLKVGFKPATPGFRAVEASQPGGGGPWILAGFLLASSGDLPPPTVQPGFPCTPSDTCAQAAPFACSCTLGRCACK